MRESRFKTSIQFLDLGLQFAVAVAMGVGLGYLGDRKWHTFPLFFIIGLLIGAAAGFLNIYRAVFPPQHRGKNTPQ